MRCVICKQADTQSDTATVTLERDKLILVIKGVPAQVCPNCGEEYINARITEQLLNTAEQIAKEGAHIDIREYVHA